MDIRHLHMMMPDFASLPSTHPGRFLSEQAANSSNSPPSTSNSSQLNDPYGISYQFNGSMAIIVVVIVVIFLFMGFCLFYLKNRRSSQLRIISFRQQRQVALGTAPALTESNGLDPEMVEKFPLMRYSSVKVANAGRGSMDCSVCLTEFQEDEKLRLLPKCGHFFHADCIDLWLNSHSTCPLCRISLAATSLDQITIASLPDAALPGNYNFPPQEGDDLQLTSLEGGQANRLLESAALRALSRNSESFRKAALDAEQLPLALGDGEWSSSSRRRNSVRRSMSMEPHQVLSTINTGEMEAEGGLRDKAHIRYGSFSSVSDQMRGSGRSTSINKRHTFSMPGSDGLLAKRSEGREWVSIDLDSSTEPISSLRLFHHHDQKSHH